MGVLVHSSRSASSEHISEVFPKLSTIEPEIAFRLEAEYRRFSSEIVLALWNDSLLEQNAGFVFQARLVHAVPELKARGEWKTIRRCVNQLKSDFIFKLGEVVGLIDRPPEHLQFRVFMAGSEAEAVYSMPVLID